MKKQKNHGTPAKATIKGGRPRELRVELPIYDSIAQASEATGIPVSVFKLAKKKGCPGFRSNRIYLTEFLAWYFAQSGFDTDWDWVFKKARAERELIALEEDRKAVVAAESVRNGLGNAMAFMFTSLNRIFVAEFPALCKGLDEIAIRVRSKQSIEELRTDLKSRLDAISPEQP